MRERNDLATCSIKFNGTFLEDLVDGFYALKVSGRDNLQKEIASTEYKVDGSTFNYSRYMERRINLTFCIGGSDLFEKCEQLMGILDTENAQIIFNDEPDKYLIGSCYIEEMERQGNVYEGTITILCTNPFKYSVDESEVFLQSVAETEGADNYSTSHSYQVGELCKYNGQIYKCISATSGTWSASKWQQVMSRVFIANNTGAYKTYPRFVVEFADDVTSGTVGTNADCGFIQVAKGENRLQFGDDEEPQKTPVVSFNTDHTNKTMGGFTNATSGSTVPWFNHSVKGNATASTTAGILPSYGTLANQWHGSYITHSATAIGDFTLEWSQLFSLSATASVAKKQMGEFIVIVFDTANKPITAIRLAKNHQTDSYGVVTYYNSDGNGNLIQALEKKQFYGKSNAFGYTSDGKVRRTKSYISREDDRLIFGLACNAEPIVIYTDNLNAVGKVGFYMAGFSDKPVMEKNQIISTKFINGDTGNTFTASDLLEFDCNTAEVKLNGKTNYNLGDVGNAWSNFYLDKGINNIGVIFSDWVVSGYEPTVKMYYRKRWI